MRNEGGKEFKFNSQICTSREQSERLLALGLKIETADCYHWQETDIYGDDNGKWHCEILSEYNKDHNEYLYNVFGVDGSDEGFFIPAWSLHRLIEMMPECLTYYGNLHYISIREHQVKYVMDGVSDGYFGCWGGYTLYDKVINCIEWLIKKGYFPKEYLEEQV